MEYMVTKETASKIGVTQATISAWCREKRIPSAEQDGPGSPWRIPITFFKKRLIA